MSTDISILSKMSGLKLACKNTCADAIFVIIIPRIFFRCRAPKVWMIKASAVTVLCVICQRQKADLVYLRLSQDHFQCYAECHYRQLYRLGPGGKGGLG